MPVGIQGISWDYAAEGLRIKFSGTGNRPDAIFNKLDIPNNVLNSGAAATETWLNANLASRVFGATAPPPYMIAKVRTMANPFYFDFLVSDSPLPSWLLS